MTHILKFTSGPDDWRALLAEPTRHWRTGYSARTLAHCWEATAGFPPEVSVAFAAPPDPRLADLEPLLAVPEFRVPLPGGERSSQNDIFVLAHSKAGPVSIMVEGKVNETFGPTLDEWQADSTPGKKRRLALLLETLALPGTIDSAIRYQLLHRAASAVLEGELAGPTIENSLNCSASKRRSHALSYLEANRLCRSLRFGFRAI